MTNKWGQQAREVQHARREDVSLGRFGAVHRG
eukprot:CAMPEP_0194535606 /NCGR_PEP_ID=MMETSP0253-20130528/74173_1 /TAXON_ID=2966 /ORGANISM="Noctiluca scintillans" /LENGTH=31 /DNA_ID= /DNA_START= /DNA_END= /DNA_ORIENTATION=